MLSSLRLRAGPRALGIMQYAQLRLHPSCTLTTALVRAGTATSSSKTSSLVCGTKLTTFSPLCKNCSTSCGSRARCVVPAVTSAPAEEASSKNACGQQPVSTVTTSGLSCCAFRSALRLLEEPACVTVQLFTTNTSAGLLASTMLYPCARKSSCSAEVSFWFTLQPNV